MFYEDADYADYNDSFDIIDRDEYEERMVYEDERIEREDAVCDYEPSDDPFPEIDFGHNDELPW